MPQVDIDMMDLIAVGLLGLLLTTVCFLLWLLHDKNRQLKALTAHPQPVRPDRYNFYDEKGDLCLSVRPEMVYYLESADNYVIIHYMNSGKMEKLFLRNTLKNIEWRFREYNLVRCHRSYIVNMDRVQMLRRQEGEAVLDFSDERIPSIPVSKGYGETILNLFTIKN